LGGSAASFSLPKLIRSGIVGVRVAPIGRRGMRRLDEEKGYPFKETPRRLRKIEIERNPRGLFSPAVSVRLVVLKNVAFRMAGEPC